MDDFLPDIVLRPAPHIVEQARALVTRNLRTEPCAAFAKAVAKRLEKEGVALDAGAYRDAPPGLRIWCGATVEASDVAALMPWVEHAFQAEIAAQAVDA